MQWHFDAAAVRQGHEHNQRAWLAYTIAALTNARRPQPLKSLMVDPETGEPARRAPADRRRQTPEQQIAIVRRLNAMFGGTVERRPLPGVNALG